MGEMIKGRKELEAEGGDVWSLGSVYQIEHNKMKDEIKQLAGKAVLKSDVEPQAAYDTATGQQAILTAKNDIKRRFHPDSRLQSTDTHTYEAAEKETFKRMSPTKSSVRTWRIIAIISVIIEFVVIVSLSLAEGELNPPQLLVAAVLAAGGWLAGMGIGQLLFNKSVDDMLRRGIQWIGEGEKKSSLTLFLTLFSGLLMVLACSAFRYWIADKDITAGGITFLLGLFIMVSEANALVRKEQYEKYADLMLEAQIFYAVREHNKFNPLVSDAATFNVSSDPLALAYIQAVGDCCPGRVSVKK